MPKNGAASVALEHWKNRVRRISVASQSGGRLARSRADGPHPINCSGADPRQRHDTLDERTETVIPKQQRKRR